MEKLIELVKIHGDLKHKNILDALIENNELFHTKINGVFCKDCGIFLFDQDYNEYDENPDGLGNRFFQGKNKYEYICYICSITL